ncbi:unnamed protein product [Urochloa humidicola]
MASAGETTGGGGTEAEINQEIPLPSLVVNGLISNSLHALDKIKAKFGQPAQPEPELSIRIVPDKADKTLTIVDNGTGMTRSGLYRHAGAVAQLLGTKGFMVEALPPNADGLGLCSAYAIADKVVITTKHVDDDQQYKYVWESGSFAVKLDAAAGGEWLDRGTKIMMFLKENHLEYLDERRLQDLVYEYPGSIGYPIYIWSEEEGDDNEDEETIDGEGDVSMEEEEEENIDGEGDVSAEEEEETIDDEGDVSTKEEEEIIDDEGDVSTDEEEETIDDDDGDASTEGEEAMHEWMQQLHSLRLQALQEISREEYMYKSIAKSYDDEDSEEDSARLAGCLRYHSTNSGGGEDSTRSGLKVYATPAVEGQMGSKVLVPGANDGWFSSAAEAPLPEHQPWTLRATEPRPGSSNGFTPLFKMVTVGRCYNCLGTDHFVASCRSPTRCLLCFRPGHIARDCALHHDVYHGPGAPHRRLDWAVACAPFSDAMRAASGRIGLDLLPLPDAAPPLPYKARVCVEGVPAHARQLETLAGLFTGFALVESLADDDGALAVADKEAACVCVWVWTRDPDAVARAGTLMIQEPRGPTWPSRVHSDLRLTGCPTSAADAGLRGDHPPGPRLRLLAGGGHGQQHGRRRWPPLAALPRLLLASRGAGWRRTAATATVLKQVHQRGYEIILAWCEIIIAMSCPFVLASQVLLVLLSNIPSFV